MGQLGCEHSNTQELLEGAAVITDIAIILR